MADLYQATYDAVRSRIHGGDIGQAVESATRDAFSGAQNQLYCIGQGFTEAAHEISREHVRPSSTMRPAISIDGNQWCALYGKNLQDGVAGFGDSPAAAMADCDRNWLAPISSPSPLPSTAP